MKSPCEIFSQMVLLARVVFRATSSMRISFSTRFIATPKNKVQLNPTNSGWAQLNFRDLGGD
jgi:hypothetical protein